MYKCPKLTADGFVRELEAAPTIYAQQISYGIFVLIITFLGL